MGDVEIRKLIQEIIAKQVGILQEHLPDESFADSPPSDLKAWLFYYKQYAKIADEAMTKIHNLSLNGYLNDAIKLEHIQAERETFRERIASLIAPNLNQ